ncbi:hypothetical protein ABPG72_005707 [Tetrahymena utriculariae]
MYQYRIYQQEFEANCRAYCNFSVSNTCTSCTYPTDCYYPSSISCYYSYYCTYSPARRVLSFYNFNALRLKRLVFLQECFRSFWDNNSNGYQINGNNCWLYNSTCLTCNSPSSNNCLSCMSGQFLFKNNTCSSTCNVNNGYYINETNCLQCNSSCLTCYGINSNNCLQCPSITCRLYCNCSVSNTCTSCKYSSDCYFPGTSSCDYTYLCTQANAGSDTYTLDSTNRVCCIRNCQTCKNNGNEDQACLTCLVGYYLPSVDANKYIVLYYM